MTVFALRLQGSSQTDESSSQRTSSSVLAKEALIEIDYSSLSEDLKVKRLNTTSVSVHEIVCVCFILLLMLKVISSSESAPCRTLCQRRRSRGRPTHSSSVWTSSRASCRGSALPTWRPWKSSRVSGTSSRRPVMVRELSNNPEVDHFYSVWRSFLTCLSWFRHQSLKLLVRGLRRPNKPLSRSRKRGLTVSTPASSLWRPTSMRFTKRCLATAALRYVFCLTELAYIQNTSQTKCTFIPPVGFLGPRKPRRAVSGRHQL